MYTTISGGNTISRAAAIAAIQLTFRDNLPQRAAELGAYFMDVLRIITEEFPGVYEKVIGKGLLIGQHFINDEVG
jgi:putrescine aminotransferase